MTKTRSGDEEDNTSAPEKNVFDGKEYKWFELDELPNIPFKDFGWMWPTREGYHVNGPSEEICIKRFVKDEEVDKLKADNTYHDIDYNWGFSTGTLRHMPNLVTRVSDVDEHALMFANLGEVYENKPKSIAHLMFNT